MDSIYLAKRQFELRKRLEKSIEKFGYTDEVFLTTIEEWCARQTAVVATERAGCKDEYIELCNQKKDIQQLPFIPHL